MTHLGARRALTAVAACAATAAGAGASSCLSSTPPPVAEATVQFRANEPTWMDVAGEMRRMRVFASQSSRKVLGAEDERRLNHAVSVQRRAGGPTLRQRHGLAGPGRRRSAGVLQRSARALATPTRMPSTEQPSFPNDTISPQAPSWHPSSVPSESPIQNPPPTPAPTPGREKVQHPGGGGAKMGHISGSERKASALPRRTADNSTGALLRAPPWPLMRHLRRGARRTAR
eukprot:gene19303-61541_t